METQDQDIQESSGQHLMQSDMQEMPQDTTGNTHQSQDTMLSQDSKSNTQSLELAASQDLENLIPSSNGELLDQSPIYQGPTLTLLQVKLPQSTICQECPKAMWIKNQRNIKCFCQVMYSITYQDDQIQPTMIIESYDQQIIAIQEMLLAKESGE
ncbi:hypothetical protein [Helicobacter fennelliae]